MEVGHVVVDMEVDLVDSVHVHLVVEIFAQMLDINLVDPSVVVP